MNNELPKNETLIQIDGKLTKMMETAKATKEGTLDILGNPKVLPDVLDNVSRVQRKLDKIHGENLLEIMNKDDRKMIEVYGS